MQRNQIIGIGLVGIALVGFVSAFTFGSQKPEPAVVAKATPVLTPAPAPAPVNAPAAVPVAAPQPTTAPVAKVEAAPLNWRHFQCRRANTTVADYKLARAEFMGRRGDRVYWRVFTPDRNTVETAHTFNINPSSIVCSYVKG